MLREVDAGGVPEIVVINKADAADPIMLARLVRSEPHSVVVSCRTGQGLDELLAAIERDLPSPDVEVHALVPYERGSLVSRIHRDGIVQSEEHTADGTLVRARVGLALAAELAPYALVGPTDDPQPAPVR